MSETEKAKRMEQLVKEEIATLALRVMRLTVDVEAFGLENNKLKAEIALLTEGKKED